jgi:hypothetical protein
MALQNTIYSPRVIVHARRHANARADANRVRLPRHGNTVHYDNVISVFVPVGIMGGSPLPMRA